MRCRRSGTTETRERARLHAQFCKYISKLRIPIKAGQIAFVIGFPESLSVGFGLPIWKSTFIASEPFYSVQIGGRSTHWGLTGGQLLPAFFLDGLTRSGMSGSPVFAQFSGMWSTKDPYEAIDPDDPSFWTLEDVAMNATGTEFVGIYSGRVTQREEEAALGLCWRKDVIEQICQAGVRAKS